MPKKSSVPSRADRRALYFKPSPRQLARAHELGVNLPVTWFPQLLSAQQLDSFLGQIEEMVRLSASVCADIAKAERGIPSMEGPYLRQMVKEAGFAEVLRFVRAKVFTQPPIYQVTVDDAGKSTTTLIGFVAPPATLTGERTLCEVRGRRLPRIHRLPLASNTLKSSPARKGGRK